MNESTETLFKESKRAFENGEFQESLIRALKLERLLYGKSARENDIDYEQVLSLIGYNYIMLKDFFSSKKIFEKMLTLNPFSCEGAFGLFLSLYNLGYKKNALLWLDWLRQNENLEEALNSFYVKKAGEIYEFEFDA